MESSARIVYIEASRRLGEHIRATPEGMTFSGLPADDPAYSLRDDDYMKFELDYYP